MELIQIIYSVLMLTCGILVVIVVFSFILSKMNKENSQRVNESKTNDYIDLNKPLIYIPINKKRKEVFAEPRIFQIDKAKPKEVNIILKPTMFKSSPGITNELKKTNGRKFYQRYTIVNDELYKKNNRAANYYL